MARVTVLFVVVTLLAGGPVSVSAQAVKRGPYLQNNKKDGMTVMWEGTVSTPGEIEYGETAVFGNLSAKSTVAASKGQTFIHKVRLAGLKPATRYQYRVKMGTTLSATKTFATNPDGRNANFRFAVWGDSHHKDEKAKRLFRHIVDSSKVDFAVSVGDVCNSGNNYADMSGHFLDHPVQILGTRIPFQVAMGNHDVGGQWGGGDDIRRFVDQACEMNSDPNCFNGSYVMEYGGVILFMIDWNRHDTDIPGWVESQMQTDLVKKARFVFFLIHRPTFVERWFVAEDEAQKKNLPPILEKYGVNMQLSGHTHSYERGRRNGVYYVVTGGMSYLDAGSAIQTYNFMTQAAHAFSPPGFNGGLFHNYVTVEVKDSLAIMRAMGFTEQGAFTGVMDTVVMVDEQWKPAPTAVKFKAPLSMGMGLQGRQLMVRPLARSHYTLTLFNTAGKAVLKKDLPGDRSEIVDLSGLKTGMYVVRRRDSHRSLSAKILLQ